MSSAQAAYGPGREQWRAMHTRAPSSAPIEMKHLMVTACTSEIVAHCGELLENKREYAARHGFEVMVVRENWLPGNLHPAYMKLPALTAALELSDLVLWVDMDVAFTDMTRRVSDMLPRNQCLGALEERKDYMCSGILLMRSPMRRVLELMWESIRNATAEQNNTHPWEQWHLNRVMAEMTFAGWERWTWDQIGAFWEEGWWTCRPWKDGDFTVHMGSAPWEKRRQAYLNKYSRKIRR